MTKGTEEVSISVANFNDYLKIVCEGWNTLLLPLEGVPSNLGKNALRPNNMKTFVWHWYSLILNWG